MVLCFNEVRVTDLTFLRVEFEGPVAADLGLIDGAARGAAHPVVEHRNLEEAPKLIVYKNSTVLGEVRRKGPNRTPLFDIRVGAHLPMVSSTKQIRHNVRKDTSDHPGATHAIIREIDLDFDFPIRIAVIRPFLGDVPRFVVFDAAERWRRRRRRRRRRTRRWRRRGRWRWKKRWCRRCRRRCWPLRR